MTIKEFLSEWAPLDPNFEGKGIGRRFVFKPHPEFVRDVEALLARERERCAAILESDAATEDESASFHSAVDKIRTLQPEAWQ